MTDVSIQIMNPETHTVLRVFLDRKLIYEGRPERSPLANQATIPIRAGTFSIADHPVHTLMAEAPAQRVKAQLQWSPRRQPVKWIVIRYEPGRPDAEEPPFFSLELREAPAALK